MNPYERRIIHTALQDVEGVTSHSVGSENDRKVVITLEEGVKPLNGGSRPPRSDAASASRYGKIEPIAKQNSED